MPLDLSLSPVELYRKWRDGRVVLLPFSALPPGWFDAGWQIGADLLLWMPVGALWWLSLGRPALWRLLGRALALVLAVEFVQLFVLSRVTDLTDVLVGSAGVMAGAAAARGLRDWRRWPQPRQRALLRLALALWLVLAVAVLWLPFDFELARGTAQAWWASVSRAPFATYLGRTEYGALGEILRKLAVFVPGGLLLALLARGPAPAAWPRVLVLGLLALLLEAGQVLLPSKLADLTDAVLGLLGGVIGWQLGRGLAAAPHPAPAAPAEVPAPRTPPAAAAPPRQALVPALLAVLALALALWLLARLPGVPYNVAKLLPASGTGLLSALGVAFALAWMLVAPLALLPARRRAWRLAFPLLLLGHALLAFLALRLSAPPEMLHKVIGTPVLGWGAASVLEDAGRYVALHAAFMLPLLGAVWLVRVLTDARALSDLLWWAACSALLFVPVHGVVVVAAGTDNLVELMRGGGSVGASLLLAAGWGALATAGVALAAALGAGAAPAPPWRRAPLLALAVLSALAAPALLATGLEPSLYKYGQLFSAAQFLLSAGRDSYAQGSELQLRAAITLAGGAALVALLQLPGWCRLARAAPPPRPSPPPGPGGPGAAGGSAG
jgi:glycopeptide antibiotics resistance protein